MDDRISKSDPTSGGLPAATFISTVASILLPLMHERNTKTASIVFYYRGG